MRKEHNENLPDSAAFVTGNSTEIIIINYILFTRLEFVGIQLQVSCVDIKY